ncbi:MAG: type VI secretion system membrane subunit TssM [Deltaproteobacteria bacterium]|nr:type VI secretion system membrane subunit TssM [Deltaproteobacteria bacterium]MBK8240563.1 type VI secretion system membrane subunit TssM [Deltaproteobacteria bacterium]MBK8718157.1 type VI secretion system membrane subunit TssM [Deltaproteobacteria bacterium]MBP7292195.1 type VI secretion system membrane subunit TssM [Nannocystaceae bacterium]
MAALKYIFAVLLIAAVWAVVLLLGLPMWIAIVSTVVIVAVLATFVIVKVVRARKAAKEIERALKAQADRHAASARPDLRADIESMQQEFLRAIAALKGSKLAGKKPNEALYALPWYMIIGPPGAGKSTALRQSGLRFPYQSKSGGGVQGVGGTRNCQWWMTNEAVILDTAGRYTTEDSDRDEWMSFLDLLKKNRPKQPVNGVMVAIAVTDISEAQPDEVHARAREVRARIDEVMAKLEMVVPVYVLFTKVDLLPGFVEIFGDLGDAERRQIWGFTAPVTQKSDPATLFQKHFDELAQVVERRAIRRMGDERRAESRDKIYEFPQYFEPMRDKLAAFVGELMADNVYAESPHLRGVYFTSGTQEGRTIDRIMNSMAAAFGIQPKLAYTTPQVEPKSYFLGELFEKVIFPDKNIAQRSAAKVKRQALIGHAIGGGLLLASIGMALLPVVAFRNNRELMTEAQDALSKVEEHVGQKVPDRVNAPIRLAQVDPLRAVERTLDEHADDGAPLLLRMGMYQGAKFQPQMRRLYLRTVRDELVRPFIDLTVADLKRFVQKHGPTSDAVSGDLHREYEEKLRFYLLLTATAKGGGELDYPPKGEPGLDEKQREWIRGRIADQWRDALKHLGDVADRDTMLNVADAYLDIVAEDKLYLFERELKVVENTRKILKRTDQLDALLHELLRDVEAPDLTLADISSSRKALLNDDVVVPGKYTRQAWDDGIAVKLSQSVDALLGNEWVLGWTEEEVTKNRERQLDLLRSRYFTEYIDAWKKFVQAIYTKAPSDLSDAGEILKDLTGGSPAPIRRTCTFVLYHTTLDDPDPEVEEDEPDLADQALEAGAKQLEKKAGKAGSKLEAARKKLLEERRKKRQNDPTLKINEDVKKEFADFIKFGCGEQMPAKEGEPPPPAKAVPLDAYEQELKAVRDALNAKLAEESAANNAALKKAVDTALTTSENLVNEADNGAWLASSLRKILLPPLRGMAGLAGRGVDKDLTNKYCAEVVDPMNKLLAKYPFAPKGSDVSLQQFSEFFAPDGGKLWAFYDAALAGRVPEKNHSFSITNAGSGVTAIDPRLVQFLNRARDLQRALYANGGADMAVEFDVTIRGTSSAARTTLTIDGHEYVYKNGPEQAEHFVWPGEGDKKVGSVVAVGEGFRDEFGQQSKWGLFRLLEAGTISSGGNGSGFTIVFNLSPTAGARNPDQAFLRMRIKPQEPDINPFFGNDDRPVDFMSLFRHPDLVPPKSILIGGPQCP